MLDVEAGEARLLAILEDGSEIYGATPNGDHLAVFGAVFDVARTKASRRFFKKRERINICVRNPEEVDFHIHQFGISPL